MPMIEDVLAEKTYKQNGLDVMQRVFYTLIAEPDNPHREKLQAHRNSKAIALLFKTLVMAKRKCVFQPEALRSLGVEPMASCFYNPAATDGLA